MLSNDILFIPARKSHSQSQSLSQPTLLLTHKISNSKTTKTNINVNFTYETSPVHRQSQILSLLQPQTIEDNKTKRTPPRKMFFKNQHRLSFKSSQNNHNHNHIHDKSEKKFGKQLSRSRKNTKKRLKIFDEPKLKYSNKQIKTEGQQEEFSDEETIVNKLQQYQLCSIKGKVNVQQRIQTIENNPIKSKLKNKRLISSKPKSSNKKVKVRFSYDDGFGFYNKNQKKDHDSGYIQQSFPKQNFGSEELNVNKDFNTFENSTQPQPQTYVNFQKHSLIDKIDRNIKLESSVVNQRIFFSPRKLSIHVGGSNCSLNKNKESKVFRHSKFSQKNQQTNSFQNNYKGSSAKIQVQAHQNQFRKSFQPVFQNTSELNDKTNQIEVHSQQEEQKVNHRFFDIQLSPVLLSHKKISYQQIDPLSSSLRKQKNQKQKLKKSYSQPTPDIFEGFLKRLNSLNLTNFTSSLSKQKIQNSLRSLLNGLKSQNFVFFILILLSLIILVAQLIS